jgi:hypothetical protein
MGAQTSMKIIENYGKRQKELKIQEPEQLIDHLKEIIKNCFTHRELGLFYSRKQTYCLYHDRCKRSGKTTTIRETVSQT